ncbi:MAG: (Fe-S)-binding protein [Candidatus Heimdallarchaeota archaeon]|nr:(Fe-S)-binding protein [Candidatus Heimdallarchaeota archaeon]
MSILKRLRKRKWIIKALLGTSFTEKRNIIRGYKKKKRYFPNKEVQADIESIIYCALCPNMCRFDCPAVQATKKETHSPATKARIAYYLEMDRLDKTTENIMPLFEGCVHCSACKIWCPFDFAVGDLLEGVAVDLYQEHALPESLLNFSERINKNNGLYNPEKYASSKKILEELVDGEIYYFPGCVTKGNNSKVLTSIKKIADIVEIKLKTDLEKQVCCGAPTIYLGDREKAMYLAQQNYDLIKKANVKAIICECPECIYMLKEQYPKLGFNLNVPIYHISEWIYSLIEVGKISLRRDEKSKKKNLYPISYHDPCVLSRKLGVIEAPYQILKEIFSFNFIEAIYSKELTHCCGFGGLVNIVNPSIANKMSQNRLAEFSKQGVKTIVTSCPTCWYSFMKNNKDMQFEIMDLLEIVIEYIIKGKN